MITKSELINDVYIAFINVKLEDGIGLWEAQGHDDRLSLAACKKLGAKDETNDWKKIPLIHLYQCSSSLSFLDAKGMLFHFPMYLLFALGVFKKEQEELVLKGLTKGCSESDIEGTLISITDYKNDINDIQYKHFYTERFSLFNSEQLRCITKYLEYRMLELEVYYKTDAAKKFGVLPTSIKYDKDYIQLQEAISCWVNKFKIK
ncbi:DUF6714 family protein [uncultured Aquimarina sp.]|uniref:DUF6714 family protein n=1 Tax=uncultured Aquimarina sp. TaxID=575652 RepID=UPI0026191B0B|nr:DUF6714 family protein [uncultured Aquimarina sp.]